MRKITITVDECERAALIQLAARERRDPRDQAAVIILRELARLGYIEPIIEHGVKHATQTTA